MGKNLGLNFETVRRAYKELEKEGLISMRRGCCSRVTLHDDHTRKDRAGRPRDTNPLAELETGVRKLLLEGMSAEDIRNSLNKMIVDVSRDLTRRTVIFTECNLHQVKEISNQLHAYLRLPVKPVLLSNLRASVERSISEEEILGVITTGFHINEVRKKLSRIPVGIHVLITRMSPAARRMLEKIDKKRPLGFICRDRDSLPLYRDLIKTDLGKDIKLFCIGIGSGEGVPIPEATGGFKKDRNGQIVLSRLDEITLKKMAVATGGTYVRSVAGDMDLDAIYSDEIRKKMDAQTLTSGRKQVWEDRFQWPLALALICLAAELMLPVTRKTIAASILMAFFFLPLPSAGANDTRDGITAYENGDFDAALKHFTDAQLADPDNFERLYNVADAYYKTGNFDAAADHYRQVLESDDDQLKQNALYNLGNAEFRRGKAKEAIGHYEAALAMDPDNRLAKENLEFVKKVLEQQQQPPKEGQQDPNQDKQGERDESQKNSSQDSSPDEHQDPTGETQADDRQQQQTEFGDEMDEQQARQQQQEPGEEKQEEQSATQAQASPSDDGNGDPGQAERMLNRLQDQPGRALMPAGRRILEKDW